MRSRTVVFSVLIMFPALYAGAQIARISGQESALLPGRVVRESFVFLGTPYVDAGADAPGFDCSGLVCTVFRTAADLVLPRTVDALFASGRDPGALLHVADLVFFDTTTESPETTPLASPSHVGIFIGGGRFVHAASAGSKTGVIVSSFTEKYYADRYRGARRLIPWSTPILELSPDGAGQTLSLDALLPPHMPLRVTVSPGGLKDQVVQLSASRDGREVLTRRVAPMDAPSSILTLLTEPGTWTVTLSSPREARILSVNFQVEE
jgi:hypothetical protein